RVRSHDLRYDGGIELIALDAGDGEEPAVAVAELLDLALYHATHRLGELSLEVGDGAIEPPATVVGHDHLLGAHVAQQIHHEQRAALGLGVDERLEGLRKVVIRKLEGEESCDVALRQEVEGCLAVQPAPLELEL